MIKQEFKISNKLGMHARPSAQVTQIASRFQSDIFLTKAGRKVNAKSIMGVMMLAAGFGTVLEVEAEGDDAAAAVEAIGQLIDSRFGESQ